MRKRIFMLVLILLFSVSQAFGQTAKGDLPLGFEGVFQRSEGRTSAKFAVSPAYMITNRFILGASFEHTKPNIGDSASGVAAKFGYLFNFDPGKQGLVPYITFGLGAAWSGGQDLTRIGSNLGVIYYINRSIGFSFAGEFQRLSVSQNTSSFFNPGSRGVGGGVVSNSRSINMLRVLAGFVLQFQISGK